MASVFTESMAVRSGETGTSGRLLAWANQTSPLPTVRCPGHSIRPQRRCPQARARHASHVGRPELGVVQLGRAGQVIGSDTWEIVFASKFSSDFNLFRRGGNCLFPLYIYSTKKSARVGERRVPNLNSDFVKAFSSATTLDFIPDGTGNLTTTFGPEDVFHYIYASPPQSRIPPPLRRLPQVRFSPRSRDQLRCAV